MGCSESEIVEITDEELEGLTEKERMEYINKVFEEWIWQQIESSTYWKEIKD